MNRPQFLEMSGEAIENWRGHPVSAALLQWLAWEADRCNYECAALLRKGKERQATAVAGKAEAMEEAIAICMRQPEAVRTEDRDEEFVDHVYRFNPELATKEGAKDAGTE